MTQKAGRATVGTALQREQVLSLRVKGLTIRAIAKRMDKSPGRIHGILVSALDELHAANLATTEQMVELEMQRLDRLLLSHWHRRRSVESAAVILKIMERRAKLGGYDKPVKTAFTDPSGLAALPAPTLLVEFTDVDPSTDESAESTEGLPVPIPSGTH